jgi:hypothetical protein
VGSGECGRPLRAMFVVWTDGYLCLSQAWDAVTALVSEGSKHDRDGIDIHFMNRKRANKIVMV